MEQTRGWLAPSLHGPGTIVLLTLLTACQAPSKEPVPTVDATQLLRRYNHRTQSIDRLWAHAVIEITWTDEAGKRHSEQGDGTLILRKPGQIALSIGKLGNTWYWLGCDEERYWWFDLNPQDDSPNSAYVGRHAEAGKPGVSRPDIPIPPDQLIQLLGVTDLPAPASDPQTVAAGGGEQAAVWFEVPRDFAGQPALQRVLVGGITARPLAIEFHAADGRVIAEARLSGYTSLKDPHRPPGAWALVPGRIEVRIPARNARLTLHLSRITSDGDKFSDAQFDFESLVKALKPERTRELEGEL